ncbi:hypothetical protein LTR85_004817 [Meristemomyces frigidus]|nr:hypothetical protein LTR85_004817 [Meristemomyces frigidus]
MAKRKRAASPSPDPSLSPEASVSPEPTPESSPPPAKRAKTAADKGKGKAATKKATSKTTKITKPTKNAKAAALATADDEVAPGFKNWMTSTKLISGGKLSKEESQFNVASARFSQVVDVENSDAFTLKPLTLTEGQYKGRHILMLEPVTPTEYFRFLDLPPELRGMVYDLLLQQPEERIIMDTYKPVGQPRRPVRAGFRSKHTHKRMQWDKLRGKWVGQKASNFSLLRVNQQLREEAAAVVYGNHTFACSDMAAMLIFLETIGGMRKHLRHVKLGLWHNYQESKTRPIFDLLKEAKGLRTLEIEHRTICSNPEYTYGKVTTAEGFVRDCLSLLKTLHKEQQEAATSVDVRDIIKVGEVEKCWACRRTLKDDCNTMTCKYPCKDVQEHNMEFAAEFRALVAKAVGIEE